MAAHTDIGSYPFELAGAPASPPLLEVEPELVQAWRDYEDAEADQYSDEPDLYGAATNFRPAACLVVLLAEADATNPRRDKTSDGGIGDRRHQSLGKASDHNPWVIVAGTGVYRARDFDTDGLDVPGAFERIRARAARGELPQVLDGGYAIVNGRITAPDWSGWLEYSGTNPHVTHGHLSVSRDPRRFDDRRPWHVWTPPKPATTRPTTTTPRNTPPAPTRAPATRTQDLRGRAFDLRGEQGATGPRVRALQLFLRRWYPAYARALAADGVWGPKTSGVVRQFAQRSGIRSADGLNIGPQIARKLYLAGFRG